MLTARYTNVAVLIAVIFLCSCSRSVGRSEIEGFLKARDFASLIEVVDDYITDNREDEFGYYAKATALIHTRGEINEVSNVINDALLRSPKNKIEDYSFSMSIMLLQNGYCDESLPVAARMGFDLNDINSREFGLISIGYVDCLSIYKDKPQRNMINLYERLLKVTNYDHGLTKSYIKYLARVGNLDVADDVVSRYELYKPKSKYIDNLLKQLKQQLNTNKV